MDLPFLRLSSHAIDPSDATFRVRIRHAPALRESVARCGIRTPLVVQPNGESGRHRVVSGWGRWSACPDGEPVPCFALPESLSLEAVWDILIRDNDAWNVMEIARVLHALEAVPGLDAERIVTEKLPLLGVHASRDLFRRHLRLLELPEEAQAFVEEEDLPLRRAMVFLKLPADALHGLLRCSRELHLTHNEVGEALEMLEEIAHRDRTSAARVLEEIGAASANGGKEGFRRALRERRYPELTRHRDRLEALQKELRFTMPVRVEWDSRLERPGIRLAADLADVESLATFERELAAQREMLGRFFEVL